MELPPDVFRYLVWSGIVAVGALLAVFDRRFIGWPVLAVLLVGGLVAGIVITRVSPFTLSGEDHFFEGVVLSAGSALALVGYVVATVLQLAHRFLRRRRRP
jgi:hypothetical protein